MTFPPRIVTLVLCRSDGTVLGALPPFAAPLPYGQDARDVTAGARRRHGIDVTVLRLLFAARPGPGGPVTYLAETADPAPDGLTPWLGDPSAPHPLRLPYAEPGGPAADLAWALDRLAEAGIAVAGPAEQLRTWNLSAITSIPTARGPVWLKCVPAFFTHEGPMMQRLGSTAVAPVISTDGTRTLMADVPGEDHYDADLTLRRRLLDQLHDLQARNVAHVDALLALGLPDWREDALRVAAEHVVATAGDGLADDERRAIDSLLNTWAERFAQVRACGIPDTLVHGDLHPGNSRGAGERLVILDWGDSGVGQPLLDASAFLAGVPETDAQILRAQWAGLWRATVPGCDPERAADLLAPIAALRHAVVYQGFLDRIEPDERIYHAHDPLDWLRRTAALA